MPLLARPAPPARRSRLQRTADRLSPSSLALGRAGAGGVMLLRPRALPQALGVDSATATRVGWAVQMLGAREVALGLGALAALRRPDRDPARGWIAAGVLCDAVDVLALAGALARGRVRTGPATLGLAVALGAVAAGSHALAQDTPAA